MKHYERYRWDGQVTVFALMIFMVVLSVLIGQYRSALFYACYTDANTAARLSADAFLAAYHRELRNCYGILAVDAGCGQKTFNSQKIEQKLLQDFKRNIEGSLIRTQVELVNFTESPIYTWLIDGDWEFFIRELNLNCQEKLIDQGVEWIAEQWKTNNNQAEKELVEKKKGAEQAENDSNSSSEGELQESGVSDPREGLMSIWNQGILVAASPSGFKVSEKEMSISDLSYPETGERLGADIDFEDENSVLALFDQWENILNPELLTDSLSDNLVIRSYIHEYFQNACNQTKTEKSQSVLDYEIEYLIGGQNTDEENLKNVLWKLLALRCAFNLSYLMMSVEKSQQVTATAAALSSAMLIPQFTEVTAFILKVMWAFAESLSDCRALLSGRNIPLVKDDDTWYLTWESMLSLKSGMLDGNQSEEGWRYDTYLQILMTFTEQNTICRRMTHLMEKNIRKIPGNENFWMKNCIYGIQVNYTCSFVNFGDFRIQTALSY